MEHIYQQPQFGEPWFNYSEFYKGIIETFDSGSTFVEIGSWKGKSSAFMAVEIANSNKDISFYCIDTWEGSVEHQGMNCLTTLYDTFLNNMKPVESYYFPLKIPSLSAASKFKDESVDFVYIDASHEYEDVLEDIKAWLPKVKPGGIISGHDYGNLAFGVTQAVDELIPDAVISIDENVWWYQIPEKLKDFPPVHFISIVESANRRQALYKMFKDNNISTFTSHIYQRYKDEDHKIAGRNVDYLAPKTHRGPVTSHIKAIKEWYENTDEPYAVFFEDDVSFDLVKYWNFTWKEFFDNLPPTWECVQLSLVTDNYGGSSQHLINALNYERIRTRDWCDWSCCAYLIKRSHAKKIVEAYYPHDTIILEYRGWDLPRRNQDWTLRPTPETLVYTYFEENVDTVFCFPIFIESNTTDSTWSSENTLESNSPHKESQQLVLNWWKTRGKDLDIKTIMRYN